MPTYEYKCTKCDERFEIEQSMSDDALTSLPGDDHEHELKKVFSPIGIAFKGSGFYKNDAGGKASSTSTTSASPAGAASTDSTPATPSDTSSTSSSSSSSSSDSSTPAATPAASD